MFMCKRLTNTKRQIKNIVQLILIYRIRFVHKKDEALVSHEFNVLR